MEQEFPVQAEGSDDARAEISAILKRIGAKIGYVKEFTQGVNYSIVLLNQVLLNPEGYTPKYYGQLLGPDVADYMYSLGLRDEYMELILAFEKMFPYFFRKDQPLSQSVEDLKQQCLAAEEGVVSSVVVPFARSSISMSGTYKNGIFCVLGFARIQTPEEKAKHLEPAPLTFNSNIYDERVTFSEQRRELGVELEVLAYALSPLATPHPETTKRMQKIEQNTARIAKINAEKEALEKLRREKATLKARNKKLATQVKYITKHASLFDEVVPGTKEQPTVKMPNALEANVWQNINAVRIKEAEFKSRIFSKKAADAAKILHEEMTESYLSDICFQPNKAEWDRKSAAAIQKAEPELKKQRGGQRIIKNLINASLLLVFTAGVGFVAYYLYRMGRMLFDRKADGSWHHFLSTYRTDARHKLERLRRSITLFAPPQKFPLSGEHPHNRGHYDRRYLRPDYYKRGFKR